MSYFCGSWCQIESCYFPHHVIFLCFLVVHFLFFTSQPRDINFFTTFELLFYFLLIHRAQGCQDWLNTAGQVLLLQIAQMYIVSCSDWLCRKHGKMKMVVMTFYILPTRKYKIAKLSKLNISWQTTLKILLPLSLCKCQTILRSIKMAWIQKSFSPKWPL